MRSSVSLSTTLPALTSRRYTITLYKQQGNERWQCGRSIALLAPNSTLTTTTANLTFNATGVYQVYAEVYDSSNVLVATSPSVTVTVSGQWHIDVVLPTDRNYKGTLILYNASGMVLFSTECLGQSASNADPSIYLGNTPTGECQGALVGPVEENLHGSYGPYKFISLTPISGNMKDYYWRSEFLIHGGNPEINPSLPRYPLGPTNGCIRVSNYDQLLLQNLITNLVANEYHYSTGTVSITEQT